MFPYSATQCGANAVQMRCKLFASRKNPADLNTIAGFFKVVYNRLYAIKNSED